jgi:hypothetical protein
LTEDGKTGGVFVAERDGRWRKKQEEKRRKEKRG